MDRSVKRDLKSDLMNTVDSVYSEHNNPSQSMLVESLKGVFLSSDVYDFPDLKDEIQKSINFLFDDGTPDKNVVKIHIESVILSWLYKKSDEL